MGVLNLFIIKEADNLLHLAFGKIIVKSLRVGLNSLSGQMWPPGLSAHQ